MAILTYIGFLSSLNPNDVESSNVLKNNWSRSPLWLRCGQWRAGYYHQTGTATNKPQISYANSTQFEQVSYMPDLQTTYGANGGEGDPYLDANGKRLYVPFENQSYGPAFDGSLQPLGYGVQVRKPDGSVSLDTLKVPYAATAKDQRRAFFRTGATVQHDITYRVGDGQNYFGMSVQRVDQSGIVPNDRYSRTNFTLNGGRVVDKFTANAKVQFTYQNYNTGRMLIFYQGRPLYFNLLNQPAHVPLNRPAFNRHQFALWRCERLLQCLFAQPLVAGIGQ